MPVNPSDIQRLRREFDTDTRKLRDKETQLRLVAAGVAKKRQEIQKLTAELARDAAAASALEAEVARLQRDMAENKRAIEDVQRELKKTG